MSAQTSPVKVVVLATNSEGSPEFCTCTVNVTSAQYDEGEHYDLAKEKAEAEGYEAPMIAFDARDQAARQLGEVLAWI
jgi:hypothetical protein